MSYSVKRVYKVYLEFKIFGGALMCSLFCDLFENVVPDNSIEYLEMKSAYKSEEFAKTYLRKECIVSDMSNYCKRARYQELVKKYGLHT